MILVVTLSVLCLSALGVSTESPTTKLYDTIVVGLGAAGTTAAATLARAGKRVLALEAHDRVGGRVWTRPLGDSIAEAGAEWIHGQLHNSVYELAVENSVSVLPQNISIVAYRSDGSGASEPLTQLVNFGLWLMQEGSDVNEPMGKFIEKKITEVIQEKDPELLKNNDSLESFLDLMNRAVNVFKATNDWDDVSALKGFDFLEGNRSVSWQRYGYKTLFDILLNIYNDGPGLPTLDIKLETEVTSIQWTKESTGGVMVTCKDGDQYSADNVIVTVSLGVLKERHSTLFSPPLPDEKVAAIEVLSIGVVNKIILLFEKRWAAKDFILFHWNADDVKKIPDEDKWITKLAGHYSPAGSENALNLFAVGDNAKYIETLPEEVVKKKAIELLQRYAGPNITVPEPIAMIRTTWFSNPFTRGSYSYTNLETPNHPGLRKQLAAPVLDADGVPRVLFAGEATDSTHYSTVHGASDSGRREAQRLLSLNKI